MQLQRFQIELFIARIKDVRTPLKPHVVVFNVQWRQPRLGSSWSRSAAALRQFVSYIDPEGVIGFRFSLLMALPAVLAASAQCRCWPR